MKIYSIKEIVEASNNILKPRNSNIENKQKEEKKIDNKKDIFKTPLVLNNEILRPQKNEISSINHQVKIRPEIKDEIINEIYLFLKKKVKKNTLKIIIDEQLEIKNLKNQINFLELNKDKLKDDYRNLEKKSGYKENDLLGGDDPYSGSKAGAELAIRSYWKSFLSKNKNLSLAIARAGNVIGGGDWSPNRLIPDCIRSILNKKIIFLRKPNFNRPWQFVLEPIKGYLMLAKKQYENPKKYSGAWNFGPKISQKKTVEYLVGQLKKYWPYSQKIKVTINKNNSKKKEDKLLHLDYSKSKKYLNWKPKWNTQKTIKQTINWYAKYYKNENIYKRRNRYSKKKN